MHIKAALQIFHFRCKISHFHIAATHCLRERAGRILLWFICLSVGFLGRSEQKTHKTLGSPERSLKKQSFLDIWQEISEPPTQCCEGESSVILTFRGNVSKNKKSHRVLSSPASSRVSKPSTALQLTPLPSVCELSPSSMNYGSEKYSWACFSESAKVLDSVRFFRTDLRTNRWSSRSPGQPKQDPSE